MTEPRCLFIQLAGLLVLAVGALGLLGYATGNRQLTTWDQDTAMAFPTCVEFIIIGACLFSLGKRHT